VGEGKGVGHDSRRWGTPGTHPHGLLVPWQPLVPMRRRQSEPQRSRTVARICPAEGALAPIPPRPASAPARCSERTDLLRGRPRTFSVIPTHARWPADDNAARTRTESTSRGRRSRWAQGLKHAYSTRSLRSCPHTFGFGLFLAIMAGRKPESQSGYGGRNSAHDARHLSYPFNMLLRLPTITSSEEVDPQPHTAHLHPRTPSYFRVRA
jgi:hypothetical protein